MVRPHRSLAANRVALPVARRHRLPCRYANGLPSAAQAAATNRQRAQAFWRAFLERAPDGHRFADAFHLRGERGVGLRKFLEGEARDLGDHVIYARLEARE